MFLDSGATLQLKVATHCNPTYKTGSHGGPNFETGDGSHHLYWSSPSNLWIIDNDLDDEFRQLFIHASTSLPPVGLYGEWREWCDGEWTPSTLTLAEVIRSENLFSLSFPFW